MESKGLYPSLASSAAPAAGGFRAAAGPGAAGARRHQRRPSARWTVRTGVLLGIFAISTLYFAALGRGGTAGDDAAGRNAHRSRHLLLAPNTTGAPGPGGIESCDFETQHVTALFVVVYIILIVIFFISLALICDDFFVPSLEVISERLELSEDVAGATFMAAGSSAPELFTSLAGVTVESDVGVGTIVGSALFNILIIVALSAALAGQVLQLDWRPLLRDSICYGVSIICFIIFSWDGVFELYEAIILLALYLVYIAIMKFNSSIMELNCKRCRRGKKVEPLQAELGEADKVTPADQAFTPAAAVHQKPAAPTDRKLSIISTESGGALPRSSSSHKHIFHHVKHGELASNFTSSQIDVRRPGDADSQCGSHYGGRTASRMGSLAGSVIAERGDDDEAADPSSSPPPPSPAAARLPPPAPSARLVVVPADSGRDPELPSSPTDREMRFAAGSSESGEEPAADAGSLGGLSFGSRSHLLPVPASSGLNNDADSGIHSAQGPTPVLPLPEPSSDDPPFVVHSDPNPSGDGPKASKRHSITVVHHEHLVLPSAPAQAEGDTSVKEEIIEEDEIIDEELTLRPIPCLPAISMYYPDREVLQSRCGCLRYALKWLMFCVSFPFMCAFTWTIPNCSNPKYKRFYVLSFTLSIVWIAVLSFAMVTLVIKVGCILTIDHYAMGIVFVAIGTSVPDALSSVLVARDGFGDMAVSNAIGSNVFDINLGLGLPFLISIIVFRKPVSLLTEYEFGLLASGDLLMTPHAKFGFILLGILLVTLFVFALVRFKLNRVVGVSFVCIYVIFLIYAFLQEVVCKYVC